MNPTALPATRALPPSPLYPGERAGGRGYSTKSAAALWSLGLPALRGTGRKKQPFSRPVPGLEMRRSQSKGSP